MFKTQVTDVEISLWPGFLQQPESMFNHFFPVTLLWLLPEIPLTIFNAKPASFLFEEDQIKPAGNNE